MPTPAISIKIQGCKTREAAEARRNALEGLEFDTIRIYSNEQYGVLCTQAEVSKTDGSVDPGTQQTIFDEDYKFVIVAIRTQ